MAGQLEGRIAVVTGGTGALGSGVVAALEGAGARVAVLHDGSAGAPRDPEVLTVETDVSDPARVDAAFAAVREELGEVDVLVAGASHRALGSFLGVSESELRRCLEVDVRGSLLCVQQVATRLLERGSPGRLILLGSVAGLRTVPGSCPQAIAKAMAATLAQVAAMELGGAGITCNFVAAGWTPSSFLAAEADEDLAIAATPTGRLTDPAEVGAVCAFLASAAAAGINGAVIPVDGGYGIAKSPGGSPIREGR